MAENTVQNEPERCRHCNAVLAPDDNYCRFCGTKRGEGSRLDIGFSVKRAERIYGSPSVFHNVCPKCGYEWNSTGLGLRNYEKFCPVCGSPSQNKETT